jgi:hypothetical protein
VRSKIGVGHPIILNYLAPLCKENSDNDIDYDFRKFRSDSALLDEEDGREYCLKICTKICYYVSMLYNQEILSMRAEFIKDDSGTVSMNTKAKIWFFFASKIFA